MRDPCTEQTHFVEQDDRYCHQRLIEDVERRGDDRAQDKSKHRNELPQVRHTSVRNDVGLRQHVHHHGYLKHNAQPEHHRHHQVEIFIYRDEGDRYAVPEIQQEPEARGQHHEICECAACQETH